MRSVLPRHPGLRPAGAVALLCPFLVLSVSPRGGRAADTGPATLAKLTRIQTYHLGFFAQFVARLQSAADGDAPLLDRRMIVYGAGISDSNRHLHERLPVLVVGEGNGC